MRALIAAMLSGFVLAAPSFALAQEIVGRDHAYATLLLSEPESHVKFAARALYRAGSARQEVVDLFAEVAWAACSETRKLDSDTLSWLAKALGNTKQPRYAGVLDYCLSKVSDEKTKKYITQAKDSIGESAAGNAFEGGKMDLGAWRSRLMKKNTSASRSQMEGKFESLRKNQLINEVYAALGTPDEVSIASAPGKKVGHAFVKVRTEIDILVVSYRELGAVRFIFGQGANDWIVADAAGMKGLFWSPEEGHFVSVDGQIANGDGSQLREISGHLIKRGSLDRGVLDRVAERIHKSRQEQNEKVADGLAWLCKVIEKSRDGRYRQFLLDVSSSAASEKLRKYATKTVSSLPETSGDQFIASSK